VKGEEDRRGSWQRIIGTCKRGSVKQTTSRVSGTVNREKKGSRAIKPNLTRGERERPVPMPLKKRNFSARPSRKTRIMGVFELGKASPRRKKENLIINRIGEEKGPTEKGGI